MRRNLGMVMAALVASACSGSGSGAAGPTEAEIVDRVGSFDTSGDFTQINAMPFQSMHAAAKVNVWVSSEGVDTYLSIDPNDTSAHVDAFPTGTLVVKEMLDDTGARIGLTVMAKGGEGGSPDAGDWWWGRFGADGALVQGGAVQFCIDCHRLNGLERTDWVRGVPPDQRM